MITGNLFEVHAADFFAVTSNLTDTRTAVTN
jgi:hypothetical protein